MSQKIKESFSRLKTNKLAIFILFIMFIAIGCSTLRGKAGQARAKSKSRDWLCYSACMMQPNASSFLCDRTCE